jgi:prolyl oligopeptidase
MRVVPRVVRAAAAAVLAAALAGCGPSKASQPSYPVTTKSDVVTDYFGTKVADPYRWMEDLETKAVADWVTAENAITSAYLEALPMRETFRKRITEVWNYPKVSVPVRAGGRYFYQKNKGLERQAPVYFRASLTTPPELAVDPNIISPDASLSLAQWTPSPNGKFIAYGLSEGGADWQTLHVRDLDAQQDLFDEVEWMRFSEISWTRDSKGFFYSRYPEPPKGKVLEAALVGQALYYHHVGTSQSDDTVIYERKDLPTWFIGGTVTEDGRFLLVTMAKGSDNNNRLYAAELGDPQQPNIRAAVRPVIEADDAQFAPIGNTGATVYVWTDRAAPNRKIIAVDVRHPAPASWKTVVPEGKQAIEEVAFIGGRVVAQYLVDVKSRLAVFGADGRQQADIALPGVGSVLAIGGREDEQPIYYQFSSPLFPATVYAYDPAAKKSTAFDPAKAVIDVSQYETTQAFATSRDGTRVPYFITAKKGLAKDGSHPTMLYGYGGFSSSALPTYRADVPAWLELGGIWVTANMRGGAEYGEAWHKAGNLGRKQNVFDDFIAVAEHLIAMKYTSPEKLGIMGASNGGLLVGAVEEQRPELFAVALPAVGVMDMLRYDKFTGGRAWVTEYGSATDAKQFPFLIKYSPVQNVKPGTCYPATLVTTADHDDRVVPSHSFKFTAAMQAAQGCDKPILIRVETMGSHGFRPTDRLIAERADLWAFAAKEMGMK